MALQLLKRNYTMQGYEAPKILKLPQGEERWAPRRLPVDIGDVMMNIRMNDDKNRYIGEHISKYAQGNNPYGEWGYPYKVNKNNIRPPIIDPKFYEPLSRMPVKFDTVTAGPIVKNLYQKRTEIAKVAPQTIIDKVCTDIGPRPSVRGDNYTDNSYHEGSIDLHLKQPRASIPYHPSIPVYPNTGVPQVELDPKIVVRPNMGIHAPFNVSDQSRDIANMRTPSHVALKPNVAPGYILEPDVNRNIELQPGIQMAANPNVVAPVPTVNNQNRDGYDLTPKVQTSAWYNPSYYLTNLSGYSIGNVDESCLDNKPRTSVASLPTYNLVDMTDRQMSERIDPMIGDMIYTSMKAPSSYKKRDHDGHDVPLTTKTALIASRNTNLSSKLTMNGDLGEVNLPEAIHAGEFDGKASVPTIQEHQNYNRTRETNKHEYFFIENKSPYGDALSRQEPENEPASAHRPRMSGLRNRLQLQEARVDRIGLEPTERVVPVGTGRFIHNTF